LNPKYHDGFHLAHRRALSLSGIDVPNDKVVMHVCDNPRCCNPAHLQLGTLADNAHDMYRKGRDRQIDLEQRPLSKLTWKIVAELRALAAAGVSRTALCEMFNVDRSVICRVVNNKAWITKADEGHCDRGTHA
jgi:hypothetical protein